ncbi:MAG: type II toxin-antitoxin system RelE/ParE family toxin [Alphaproteobacteria bacterium]
MANDKPEYRLAPKARADAEAVWLYSRKQWGPKQAARYVDELAEGFALLANSPQAGAPCENIRAGYRKYPVIRHVVCYRETGYGIEIMRILHDRMFAARQF